MFSHQKWQLTSMMMVNFFLITLFHGTLILRTSLHAAIFFVDILHQETLRYKAELMPLSASRMSEEVTFSTGDVDICRWVVPVAPGRFNSGNPKMKFSPLEVPLLFCQV